MKFKFGRRYVKPWFNLEGIAGLVGQPGLQGVSGFAGQQGIEGISGFPGTYSKKKFIFGR